MQDLGDSHEWLMYLAQTHCLPPLMAARGEKYAATSSLIVLETFKRFDTASTCRTLCPPDEARLEDWPSGRRRWRRRHWSVRFQEKFSRWLSRGEHCAIEDVLPYSREDIREHLERQFTRGMAWKFYAGLHPYKTRRRVWVVDHIIPKSVFPADDVCEAYALTNLRPLWSMDNLLKNKERQHLF